MIVLIGGEKGGTGKTTIATNLAAIRTQKGRDTLLVDTDQQKTASYWCSSREDHKIMPRIASVQKFDKSVRTEIMELKKKYQDIIIDAGGRDSTELRAGLLVADIAVIPIRASQFDLWTLARINTLIDVASDVNENLKTYVLLNQTSTNPIVKETDEAKNFLGEFKRITLLKNSICERISFRKAAISGMAVNEVQPQDIKAIAEINKLYEEIFNDE